MSQPITIKHAECIVDLADRISGLEGRISSIELALTDKEALASGPVFEISLPKSKATVGGPFSVFEARTKVAVLQACVVSLRELLAELEELQRRLQSSKASPNEIERLWEMLQFPNWDERLQPYVLDRHNYNQDQGTS